MYGRVVRGKQPATPAPTTPTCHAVLDDRGRDALPSYVTCCMQEAGASELWMEAGLMQNSRPDHGDDNRHIATVAARGRRIVQGRQVGEEAMCRAVVEVEARESTAAVGDANRSSGSENQNIDADQSDRREREKPGAKDRGKDSRAAG